MRHLEKVLYSAPEKVSMTWRCGGRPAVGMMGADRFRKCWIQHSQVSMVWNWIGLHVLVALVEGGYVLAEVPGNALDSAVAKRGWHGDGMAYRWWAI